MLTAQSRFGRMYAQVEIEDGLEKLVTRNEKKVLTAQSRFGRMYAQVEFEEGIQKMTTEKIQKVVDNLYSIV